ncbi:hypothetical protein [Streptomyces sp. KL118A]|uniref:hypothetical protein n=1 Tax=Streptomyces sp. KL118A TaxID=3045153 RepID=UPI00278BDCDC|nr:hypothetical protein [Streptomyces sp. KL118A]
MSGSDLSVDITLLKSTEKQLHSIKGEFEGIDDWKKELRSVVGEERMVKAMSTFVDNWDRHRKKLVGQIDEIGGWVESTRKTFEKADLDLAKAARNKKRQKSGAGEGK